MTNNILKPGTNRHTQNTIIKEFSRKEVVTEQQFNLSLFFPYIDHWPFWVGMTNYWDINKRRGGYIAHPTNPNRARWFYRFTIQTYADPRGHTRSIWSGGDLKLLFVYCHFLQPLFSFFNFFFFNFLAIYIHYLELGHLLHLLVSLWPG